MQECNHLFNALWVNLLNAFWVSKPENIRKASLKLFQLQLATEMGFRIPRSIVTNSEEQARSFIENNGDVVVKTLASPAIYSQEGVAEIYTHMLKKEDMRQLSHVRFGATFLQQFIPKRKDIRVTVIGKSLFAAAIDSVGFREARIDFRRSKIYNLPHEPIQLPNT